MVSTDIFGKVLQQKGYRKWNWMVLFQAFLGFSGQINKKLWSAMTASNLSLLYELHSKELRENNKKLEALR